MPPLQAASRLERPSTAQRKASPSNHGYINPHPKVNMPPVGGRFQACPHQATREDKACKCDHRLHWLHVHLRGRLLRLRKRIWAKRTDELSYRDFRFRSFRYLLCFRPFQATPRGLQYSDRRSDGKESTSLWEDWLGLVQDGWLGFSLLCGRCWFVFADWFEITNWSLALHEGPDMCGLKEQSTYIHICYGDRAR